LEGLERESLAGPVAEALGNVSDFSVRDLNSRDIVHRLTGIAPAIHVDPVLMFEFAPYLPGAPPARDYIVIYSYQQDRFDSETVRAIRKYARARGKKIISLYSYHDWCDECVIADTPFQLLRYFANADSVITNTFHGTVFSIMNNRNFVALMKDRNRHRVDFLLSQFGLSDRAADDSDQVIRKLEAGIDFSQCNSVLAVERAKALAYLGDLLESR
jgi:hypothetical protein